MEAFPQPKPHRESKLSESQLNEMIPVILTQTPLDFGFQTVLWTRAIIAKIILDKFSILLHETTVGIVLKRNKITLQKPIRKAYQ